MVSAHASSRTHSRPLVVDGDYCLCKESTKFFSTDSVDKSVDKVKIMPANAEKYALPHKLVIF